MPKDDRNPLVKSLALQQERTKQRQTDTLLFFQERAHKKVRAHNEFGRKSMVFQIPMYEVGLPLYDAFWVRKKISKLLQHDGFFVEPMNENTIMVCWDIDKLKEQEEINITEKKIRRAHKKNEAKMLKSNKKNKAKLIKL
tara:strand:+ start:2935 stop:3354 length:420 start_codon:yes stop_codon:yes gene_type:complete